MCDREFSPAPLLFRAPIEMRADASSRNGFRQQLRENNVRQSATFIARSNIERPEQLAERCRCFGWNTPRALATRQGDRPRSARRPWRQALSAPLLSPGEGGRATESANAPDAMFRSVANSAGVHRRPRPGRP